MRGAAVNRGQKESRLWRAGRFVCASCRVQTLQPITVQIFFKRATRMDGLNAIPPFKSGPTALLFRPNDLQIFRRSADEQLVFEGGESESDCT